MLATLFACCRPEWCTKSHNISVSRILLRLVARLPGRENPPPLSNNDAALPEFERGEFVCANNDCGKRLAFLLLPNKAGHTGADAARLAGYTNMAVWLENIVLLLDPDGKFKPL